MASIKDAIEGANEMEKQDKTKALEPHDRFDDKPKAKAKASKTERPEPTINPEFQDLLDLQSDDSVKELRTLIDKEGIREPIIVWDEQNEIADGHTRWKIAKEKGINCPITYKSFKSADEVREWIIRNQLARRNLSQPRMEYFIGKLYNEQKQEQMDGGGKSPAAGEGKGSTAEKIAKEFGVTPKTVRTYAKQAKGVDMLEKARGKIEKIKQLSNKPTYTGEEIAAIGTAPNTTVAAKTAEKIDSYKAEQKQKKVEAKKAAETVKQRAINYGVILVQPDFEQANAVAATPKPTMDKEAIAYVIVPDEYLPQGLKLLERWGLTYEASFVYYSPKMLYDATYTKVCHQYVLLGTKGHIVGPKSGKEQVSTQILRGEIGPQVVKLIEEYHNGGLRKLDMRRGAKTMNGWDNLTSAAAK